MYEFIEINGSTKLSPRCVIYNFFFDSGYWHSLPEYKDLNGCDRMRMYRLAESLNQVKELDFSGPFDLFKAYDYGFNYNKSSEREGENVP